MAQKKTPPGSPAPEQVEQPALRGDEPLSEAIRRVLRTQFEIMLANEAGSRVGDDIEHVHDMRVAVRRMRTAFRLFGDAFKPRSIKQHAGDLRATGRLLGKVRDLDVFNREAMRYLRQRPKSRRRDLDPLLDHWQAQRDAARLELVCYLDSQAYRRFVERFAAFVGTPAAGVQRAPDDEPVRWRVKDVLSSAVWQRYEAVRAYDRLLGTAQMTMLHALRIDCKYLRYTLEFFEGHLGPDARWLVREVIALQDHLGDIQDAEVARTILGDFIASISSDPPADGPADPAPIAAYLDYRLDEQRALLETLPGAWARVDSVRFRRRLSTCLLAL